MSVVRVSGNPEAGGIRILIIIFHRFFRAFSPLHNDIAYGLDLKSHKIISSITTNI